jgi:hypothetical protein
VCNPTPPCPPPQNHCPPPQNDCPPSTGGNGGNGGNTGDSINQIGVGGNAGNVTAGNGTYVSGTGTGSDVGGLIGLSALNGLGGSNILSPSIGGIGLGLGAILEGDQAGNGGHGGSVLNSLFGGAGGRGGNGGSTGDSVNQIGVGGDAGNVTAGNGAYADTGADGDHGSLINISALNGLGGSNILSPSIGGPGLGLGAILEGDRAGDGGNGGSVSKSLFGGAGGHGGNGGNTGDSFNQIGAGGDAGNVTAGHGGYADTAADGDHGSLISVSALNGLGGSNILSPSIGGPAVGIGAILEGDHAGDGGNGGSVLKSLFGGMGGHGGNGGSTGDSLNQIGAGGDAGNVTAGNGMSLSQGGDAGVGGLIHAALLNGVGGSNILSPSIGGPGIGIGAILEGDHAGDGGHGGTAAHAYDGHVPFAMDAGLFTHVGMVLDTLVASDHLFDVPVFEMLDVTHA